jgi:hypothetical protein
VLRTFFLPVPFLFSHLFPLPFLFLSAFPLTVRVRGWEGGGGIGESKTGVKMESITNWVGCREREYSTAFLSAYFFASLKEAFSSSSLFYLFIYLCWQKGSYLSHYDTARQGVLQGKEEVPIAKKKCRSLQRYCSSKRVDSARYTNVQQEEHHTTFA